MLELSTLTVKKSAPITMLPIKLESDQELGRWRGGYRHPKLCSASSIEQTPRDTPGLSLRPQLSNQPPRLTPPGAEARIPGCSLLHAWTQADSLDPPSEIATSHMWPFKLIK